jgi:hypothetical protein
MHFVIKLIFVSKSSVGSIKMQCTVAESPVLNPRVTLGFNIVESEGKPRVSANTLGFR